MKENGPGKPSLEAKAVSLSYRYPFVLGLILALSAPALAQTLPASKELTREQQEKFLRTARIISKREIPTGITNPERATLTDGRITHDAQIQTVNIRKPIFETASGTILGFVDSYEYNIAAYRLDKILSLRMIPVSVERRVGGSSAAVTWWIDDVLMTEAQRKRRKISVPDPDLWNKQMYRLRVFDQLIYNFDRNLGNLVITKDWRIHLIDHTRAFRREKKLRGVKNLVQCDRQLLEAMRNLTYERLEGELRPLLTRAQINALLARRDRIVEFFDKAVAEKGEQAVLYD